jgi:hypothetical protein
VLNNATGPVVATGKGKELSLARNGVAGMAYCKASKSDFYRAQKRLPYNEQPCESGTTLLRGVRFNDSPIRDDLRHVLTLLPAGFSGC